VTPGEHGRKLDVVTFDCKSVELYAVALDELGGIAKNCLL